MDLHEFKKKYLQQGLSCLQNEGRIICYEGYFFFTGYDLLVETGKHSNKELIMK